MKNETVGKKQIQINKNKRKTPNYKNNENIENKENIDISNHFQLQNISYNKEKNKYKNIINKNLSFCEITKKEYGRLAHLIDSHPKKWNKDKENSQIIDDKKYFFIYNGYNDFQVTGRRKLK